MSDPASAVLLPKSWLRTATKEWAINTGKGSSGIALILDSIFVISIPIFVKSVEENGIFCYDKM